MKRKREMTNTMSIRFSEADFDDLVERAYRMRKPVSVMIREIVLETCKSN
jgi:hypothetical protein